MMLSYSVFFRLCIKIIGTLYDAATLAIFGSYLAPHISLIISAPATIAASAVLALYVSIEIGMESLFFNDLITGTTRPISSSSDTGLWSGLVDSPPTSIIW